MFNNALRDKNGIKKGQLAKLAGISRQSIISIEKGQYVPTIILALRLAEVLSVKMEELFVLEKRDWK